MTVFKKNEIVLKALFIYLFICKSVSISFAFQFFILYDTHKIYF